MVDCDRNVHSHPLGIGNVKVTDRFWSSEQELVRTSMIPFQWETLNDRVPEATPSYAMHNFKAAARQNERRAQSESQGKAFEPPKFTNRGFDVLPKDPRKPDPDKFYGFVFQDSDLWKWIEGAAYSLVQHPDAKLEETVDGAIDIVCKAQLDNGYLDTYYILNGMDRHFTDLKDYHELYCMGHLIEAAVAYYQSTGKDKLLKAAERYADYVYETFGPGEHQRHGYPGHEIAEMALVRLYEATGLRKYLDLATYFVRERGTKPLYFEQEDRERAAYEGKPVEPDDSKPMPYAYYQAHEPVVEQDEAVGHAVRAGYFYSGVADVARLTGDKDLNAAVRRLWRNIVDKKLYITGGVGGTVDGEAFSYNYDLPNDLAYSETCASVALALFARRMLELEPKGEYADVMEMALYNTVLAGMALDGKSFFYVNPLEVRPDNAHHHDSRFSHVKDVRRKWFGCACCPPNIARTVESIQQNAYGLSDDGSTLFVHLYVGCEGTAELAGVPVGFEVEAGLPWSGKGSLRLSLPDGASSLDAAIALRMPKWAGEGASSHVTAPDGMSREERDGYLYLSGSWHDGDTIRFDFPMPVRLVAANPLVSEDAGQVAIVRGPITYCAEERDNGGHLHRLVVDGRGVVDDPSRVKVMPCEFKAGAKGVGDKREGEVEEVSRDVVELQVPGWREDSEHAEDAPLYAPWRSEARKPVAITLIPYFMWANRGENEMRVFLRVR
ncbi:beta-L-arabinofuranosidase domain-containing protein [Bifidobacterium sp. ESL0800]|uniref:glycoside hydrolase family 127 protein n=1 Tax=Bifidobacterium sp. ESL0800 TaxID=2983236 RepID=UPI0023F63251|nr:beta-L-arabinofuranosidase domain-containing protein [Bifidobacterium sp. ESL0800]WEV75940.1 glycoside hydrolase family 127 protein [Bifidobacterium sp. ESL0800]